MPDAPDQAPGIIEILQREALERERNSFRLFDELLTGPSSLGDDVARDLPGIEVDRVAIAYGDRPYSSLVGMRNPRNR